MTAHPEDATLLALLAGDLSTADAERLSAHLSDCPRCQGARQGFEAALERLHQSGAEPSPFVVARLERTIFSRLAGTSPRPKLVPRRTAATAALMAGLSGAALATGALRVFVDTRPDAAAAPIESLAPRQPPLRAAIAMPSPLPEVTSASAADGAGVGGMSSEGRLAPAGRRRQYVPLSEAAWQAALQAPESTNWLDLAERAPGAERRTEAYVRALEQPGGAKAATALRGLLREGVVTPHVLWERLEQAGGASAEGLRLRCEMGLLAAPDVATVRSCQLFGRRFPAHPAVWSLALAAGHVAETVLHDPALAVAEYSRALQAAKYAPAAGGEALWRRARARATLGERDEAAADLRLYLHLVPESRSRADVVALAQDLGVEAAEAMGTGKFLQGKAQ